MDENGLPITGAGVNYSSVSCSNSSYKHQSSKLKTLYFISGRSDQSTRIDNLREFIFGADVRVFEQFFDQMRNQTSRLAFEIRDHKHVHHSVRNEGFYFFICSQ